MWFSIEKHPERRILKPTKTRWDSRFFWVPRGSGLRPSRICHAHSLDPFQCPGQGFGCNHAVWRVLAKKIFWCKRNSPSEGRDCSVAVGLLKSILQKYLPRVGWTFPCYQVFRPLYIILVASPRFSFTSDCYISQGLKLLKKARKFKKRNFELWTIQISSLQLNAQVVHQLFLPQVTQKRFTLDAIVHCWERLLENFKDLPWKIKSQKAARQHENSIKIGRFKTYVSHLFPPWDTLNFPSTAWTCWVPLVH